MPTSSHRSFCLRPSPSRAINPDSHIHTCSPSSRWPQPWGPLPSLLPFSCSPCRPRLSHSRKELMRLQPRSSLGKTTRTLLSPWKKMDSLLLEPQVGDINLVYLQNLEQKDWRQALASSVEKSTSLEWLYLIFLDLDFLVSKLISENRTHLKDFLSSKTFSFKIFLWNSLLLR